MGQLDIVLIMCLLSLLSHDKIKFIVSFCNLQEKIESKMILTMEHLTLYHGSGQNYGYILYRKILPKTKTINIKGIMQDRMQVSYMYL